MNNTNVVLGYWKLRKWLNESEVERKNTAEKALMLIEKSIKEDSIELVDLTGRVYDVGLAVEVIRNDAPDEKDDTKIIVTEMVKPIIVKDNKVTSFGEVVIGTHIKETKRKDNNDNFSSTKNTQYPKSRILTIYLIIVLMFLSLIGFGVFSILSEVSKEKSLILDYTNKIDQLNSVIDEQSSEIGFLSTKISNLNDELQTLQNGLDESDRILIYTVKKNDTLISICTDYGIEYSAYKNIIVSLNGLVNPSHIVVGQKIMLIVKGDQK